MKPVIQYLSNQSFSVYPGSFQRSQPDLFIHIGLTLFKSVKGVSVLFTLFNRVQGVSDLHVPYNQDAFCSICHARSISHRNIILSQHLVLLMGYSMSKWKPYSCYSVLTYVLLSVQVEGLRMCPSI
jgi:hypothetical protein